MLLVDELKDILSVFVYGETNTEKREKQYMNLD